MIGDTYSPSAGATATVLEGDLVGPYMIARVELAPGASWPEETHPYHEEMILGIRGHLTVQLLSFLPMTVGAGVPWLVRDGARHVVRNNEASSAAYISILRRVRGQSKSTSSSDGKTTMLVTRCGHGVLFPHECKDCIWEDR